MRICHGGFVTTTAVKQHDQNFALSFGQPSAPATSTGKTTGITWRGGRFVLANITVREFKQMLNSSSGRCILLSSEHPPNQAHTLHCQCFALHLGKTLQNDRT